LFLLVPLFDPLIKTNKYSKIQFSEHLDWSEIFDILSIEEHHLDYTLPFVDLIRISSQHFPLYDRLQCVILIELSYQYHLSISNHHNVGWSHYGLLVHWHLHVLIVSHLFTILGLLTFLNIWVTIPRHIMKI